MQRNEGLQAQTAPLAPALARLVEEGCSKLAQRASGMSALLAACYIAAASHDANEVFKQHKEGLTTVAVSTSVFWHKLMMWACIPIWHASPFGMHPHLACPSHAHHGDTK